MRVYKEDNYAELQEMKCNKCGKSILVENGMVKEGAFNVEYNWGYFSKKDGEKHILDLCESCYDKMIMEFEIGIQKKENVELL